MHYRSYKPTFLLSDLPQARGLQSFETTSLPKVVPLSRRVGSENKARIQELIGPLAVGAVEETFEATQAYVICGWMLSACNILYFSLQLSLRAFTKLESNHILMMIHLCDSSTTTTYWKALTYSISLVILPRTIFASLVARFHIARLAFPMVVRGEVFHCNI